MPASTQLSLPGQPHLNRGLFSDYYLEYIVPKKSTWDALFNEAKAVRNQLRDLLETINPEKLDEAQLEEQWVQPVLQALGHHYFVQFKIRYQQRGFRKPDYALLNSDDEVNAMTNTIYEPSDIRHVLALADAKKWGVNFDKITTGVGNPSQQIDEYLRYSELKWGILTDGRYWRLYENNTSKYNRYYAVDLIDLLGRTVDDFLYFYIFFRREAFVTEGWLTAVLEGSTEFARQLGDNLEEQIYDALVEIAQGFLKYRRNRLQPTPETLHEIYTQSLVLLYRLLFVFYAESREILPVVGPHKTMRSLRDRVAIESNDDPDDSRYYLYLSDMFFVIDKGHDQYSLPAYNGRLFSDDDHNFLAEKVIGSAYMGRAIDLMGRVANGSGNDRDKVNVDYRDLDVRHLGAIYEKLLDYELVYTDKPLTTRTRNGKELYVEAKDGDSIKVQAGDVYLRTGNNERKITGSYYTPDYIVRFIVERTLRPLLQAITAAYATQDAEDNWAVDDAEGLVDAILNLNILDPAIGSGHFLVDVTAYIAEWLRDLGLAPKDIEEEDELIYWKRQVVSACIYGVDVNPLAVELAKLSLWLATIGRGKPLSFLDHHLRVGNSLVGARTQDVGVKWRGLLGATDENEDQLTLFEADDAFSQNLSSSVSLIRDIETTIAESVTDVKQQETAYTHMRAYIEPYLKLADVWTARYFGVSIDPATWGAVQDYVLHGTNVAGVQALVERALSLADEHRFFHWDLIFPEIFFAPDGTPKADAGFDAAVGNPPYVRQERITPYKPFFETHYEVYSGTADLFLYFYELGLRFVKDEQKLGYVTSGTYMNSNSATAFRRYIHENAGLEAIVNFGENQPFRGAEMVYPTIAVMHKGAPTETFRSYFMEGTTIQENLSEVLAEEGIDCFSNVTALPEWRFQSVESTHLFQKFMEEGYGTLYQAVGQRMYQGLKTGLNDAFIIDGKTRQALIDEHSSSENIIKRFVRGQDIRPWYQINSDLYLILTPQGIDIEQYPAIKRHLKTYKRRLENRTDTIDNWYELRSCSYYDEFEQSKIYWAEIAKLPRFSWDDRGLYATNKAHFVIPPSKAILPILNSRPIWFVISQICVPLRLRAGLWQYQLTQQFIKRLPIPELTQKQDANLGALAEEITGLANERYQLHEAFRATMLDNLNPTGNLNLALTSWWELDFPTFLEQVHQALRVRVALNKQNEWKGFLADEQAKHQHLTAEIIQREERLNAIVYDAFHLTADEIALIESSTKYPYGAV